MPSKQNLLVVNNFDQDTISSLDERYSTYHLWGHSAEEKLKIIQSLQGKCRAAATGSWECDKCIYTLNSLEIIAAFGVGVDGIDFSTTLKHGIRVTNTPGVLDDAVAELAMALILSTTKHIIEADNFVRSNSWIDHSFPPGRNLAGKTLGIIGLGRIGEAIVQRALPFKLKIAYHNRSPKNLPYTYYPTIAELAANSDILLCMLPGGDKTRNCIDKEIFQILGAEGIFVNLGRGTSVDEEALIEALEKGIIGGAGLDVYVNEPEVPKRLREIRNAVLLPHIGSNTLESRCSMGNLVIKNLEAFFSGEALITEVIQ